MKKKSLRVCIFVALIFILVYLFCICVHGVQEVTIPMYINGYIIFMTLLADILNAFWLYLRVLLMLWNKWLSKMNYVSYAPKQICFSCECFINFRSYEMADTSQYLVEVCLVARVWCERPHAGQILQQGMIMFQQRLQKPPPPMWG